VLTGRGRKRKKRKKEGKERKGKERKGKERKSGRIEKDTSAYNRVLENFINILKKLTIEIKNKR
jgi:hypothetical protein